ncbi:uncharacterized protein BX664DRAFT_382671 [Halteromyces radiatus]|uniref:uncharacterized protein n=1 Tax=Halteromyces radiatus TaxID=101107 RepID=UPI00221F5A45|nr:uncharacterized protein BX664DRAFT_382671 [Halteromyces radiatus]KAI8096185.1 hypothetical protein BX664DRAFT_382671 [Halteromyces radiatus]
MTPKLEQLPRTSHRVSDFKQSPTDDNNARNKGYSTSDLDVDQATSLIWKDINSGENNDFVDNDNRSMTNTNDSIAANSIQGQESSQYHMDSSVSTAYQTTTSSHIISQGNGSPQVATMSSPSSTPTLGDKDHNRQRGFRKPWRDCDRRTDQSKGTQRYNSQHRPQQYPKQKGYLSSSSSSSSNSASSVNSSRRWDITERRSPTPSSKRRLKERCTLSEEGAASQWTIPRIDQHLVQTTNDDEKIWQQNLLDKSLHKSEFSSQSGNSTTNVNNDQQSGSRPPSIQQPNQPDRNILPSTSTELISSTSDSNNPQIAPSSSSTVTTSSETMPQLWSAIVKTRPSVGNDSVSINGDVHDKGKTAATSKQTTTANSMELERQLGMDKKKDINTNATDKDDKHLQVSSASSSSSSTIEQQWGQQPKQQQQQQQVDQEWRQQDGENGSVDSLERMTESELSWISSSKSATSPALQQQQRQPQPVPAWLQHEQEKQSVDDQQQEEHTGTNDSDNMEFVTSQNKDASWWRGKFNKTEKETDTIYSDNMGYFASQDMNDISWLRGKHRMENEDDQKQGNIQLANTYFYIRPSMMKFASHVSSVQPTWKARQYTYQEARFDPHDQWR